MGCFYQSFWYKQDPGLENTSICSRPGIWPWGTGSQGTECLGVSGFSGFLGNILVRPWSNLIRGRIGTSVLKFYPSVILEPEKTNCEIFYRGLFP